MPKDVFRLIALSISALLFFVNGCSMNKMAIGVMGGLMENGVTALYEEDDLELAEQAIAANLKLVEALLKNNPTDKKMLLIMAQGYGGYALAFVEDVDPERASKFYLRGQEYGRQLLAQQNKELAQSLDHSLDSFQSALARASIKDVPALFWFGYNWGAYVNLNKNSVAAVADMPKILAIMQRITELDGGYYYGGAHLFLGTYYSALPKMMGGNPEVSKKHFDRAVALSEGKFLLTKVYMAQYYTRQIFDRELFTNTLEEVIAAPVDLLPEQALVNKIAKKRAESLLTQTDDLF